MPIRRIYCRWNGSIGARGCTPPRNASLASRLDRYIGNYQPYASSHAAQDADDALIEETRNAARALVERVAQLRSDIDQAVAGLESPRQK